MIKCKVDMQVKPGLKFQVPDKADTKRAAQCITASHSFHAWLGRSNQRLLTWNVVQIDLCCQGTVAAEIFRSVAAETHDLSAQHSMLITVGSSYCGPARGQAQKL